MKIVSIVGARPQFIKAAAVSRHLRRVAEEFLIHTGQHYDNEMSSVFFSELGIPRPDADLGVGSGPHGAQTGRMLEVIEKTLMEQRPDRVLVYGDTNSTLSGALAAAKLQIPIAHVEAGLRSFRRDMPEEINRVVADHLADLLFCPTETARRHLASEGIHEGVHTVGDVMVDALELIRPRVSIDRVRRLGVETPYFAATIHRAENVDHPDKLAAALDLLGNLPGTVVLPVHPRTDVAMKRHGFQWPTNVHVLDPVGYADMISLISHAEAVLTDSGGLQKEVVLCGVPCITLRDETEWVETVEAGLNALVGLDVGLAFDALARVTGDVEAAHTLFPPGAADAIVGVLTATGSRRSD